MKSLEQILSGRNLTGVIQEVDEGVPDDLLPPALFVPTRSVDGDTGEYDKVSVTRASAKRKAYGSKSEEQSTQGGVNVPFKLIHSVEHIRHKADVLINLRSEGNEAKQRKGMQTVARKTRNFQQRFTNLRLSAVYSAFSKGKIFFDSDGNILAATEGGGLDIDFSIPANNQNQANGIIDASWATAGTKILSHIKSLKKACRKLTGKRLKHAIYGSNILDYLLSNTQVKELINRSPNLREQAGNGEMPQGLFNLTWWDGTEAFSDIEGTLTDWFGADSLILFPEVDDSWYELVEGSYLVPNSIELASDSVSALDNLTETVGMFSYAKVEDDPPSIKHVAGDTFMPVIRNPNCVYILDVTF